jgi:hypothetical protein
MKSILKNVLFLTAMFTGTRKEWDQASIFLMFNHAKALLH